jgi:hypothetical protein
MKGNEFKKRTLTKNLAERKRPVPDMSLNLNGTFTRFPREKSQLRRDYWQAIAR